MYGSTLLLFAIVCCSLCTAKSVLRSPTSQQQYIKELLDWRDIGTDPCTDFYRYSCGSKLDENDPQNPFQNTLVTQQIDTYLKIHDLFKKSESPKESSFGKAVEVYKSCLEQDPKENLAMVVKLASEYGGWPLAEGPNWKAPGKTLSDILSAMGKIAKVRLNTAVMNAIVAPDPFDTSNFIVQMFQPPGMMIPYVTIHSQKLQLAQSLVAYASVVADHHQPDINEALEIIEFSNLIWQCLESYPEKIKDAYTGTTMENFTTMTSIDILAYLNSLFNGIATFKSTDSLSVEQIPYFLRLAKVLPHISLRTLMNYEMMSLVLPAVGESGILSIKMQGRDNLMPIPTVPTRLPRPRGSEPKHIIHPEWLKLSMQKSGISVNWFQCMQRASIWFSFTVAREYYRKFFTKNERRKARETTNEIIKVFQSRLNKMDWMDESALQEAKNKLLNMQQIYVYADWVDNNELLENFYHSFDVNSNYLANFWMGNKFIRSTNLRILSKSKLPLNVSITFDIGPLDVNAYYSPAENSINILAGILQPTVYDGARLELFNFASLGAVIGHEITHGFDNMGQQFDEHGNLRDWMSPKVHETFMSKADCYVNQYDEYRLTSEDFPIPNFVFKINGTITLGENIADNGGFQQAYWAYKEWVRKHGEEKWPPSLSKFTPDQIFFLTYGHLWCNKYYGTQQELTILAQDVHTPGKFRVIGTLSNFEEFAKTFGCDASYPMNRGDERCHLW